MERPSLFQTARRSNYWQLPLDAVETPTLENEHDKIPNERTKLAQWIEERKKRLRELNELQRCFIKTRDPAYLRGFISNAPLPSVDLLEKIQGPFAVFSMPVAGTLSKENIEQKWEDHDRAVREFLPGIESRTVKTTEGLMRAYIGVDTRTVTAALELGKEQKCLAAKIERVKELQTRSNSPDSVEDAKDEKTTLHVDRYRSKSALTPQGRNF